MSCVTLQHFKPPQNLSQEVPQPRYYSGSLQTIALNWTLHWKMTPLDLTAHVSYSQWRRRNPPSSASKYGRLMTPTIRVGEVMRSEAVFHASNAIESRYNLCRICAKGTRTLHLSSDRIQDTINTVLAIIGERSGTKFLYRRPLR